MTIRGQRKWINRELDYLWSLIEELELESENATPERVLIIDQEYQALKERYQEFFDMLGELPPDY